MGEVAMSAAAARSALARRLVESLLHRREQIFKHGARAKMDFGRDLHARSEAEFFAVNLKELVLQIYQGIGSRRTLFPTLQGHDGTWRSAEQCAVTA